MRFTAVAGHLTELEFEHHHKWHSCAPVELFSAPIKRFVQQVRAINSSAKFAAIRTIDWSLRRQVLH
jgi:hypothetical protein